MRQQVAKETEGELRKMEDIYMSELKNRVSNYLFIVSVIPPPKPNPPPSEKKKEEKTDRTYIYITSLFI